MVHSKYPDWHLDLYGEGHLMGKLLYEAKRLNIGIEVHKPCSDIFSKYIESSIFVMSSIFEPFGLVLPEAMSCGLPVVAFNCPYGPKDLIDHEKCGFVIENGNINHFANKLCYLIDHPEIREQFAMNAIKKAQTYNVDNIMNQWKLLFESLLSSNK